MAGLTPYPDQRWMTQIARNVTMAEWGFLLPGQYLILDLDGKFCSAFQQTMEAAGVHPLPGAARQAAQVLLSRGGMSVVTT